MPTLTSRLTFAATLALAVVPALAEEPSTVAARPRDDAALLDSIVEDLTAVFDGVELDLTIQSSRCGHRVCCTDPY